MKKLPIDRVERRTALCKALFLAPTELFCDVSGFINISINTYIEQATGERPDQNFPLSFMIPKSTPTIQSYPKGWNVGKNKDPEGRAELCKVIFLITASMFRDIERYFYMCLKDFIEEKTGKRPNKDFPLDFWINKGIFQSQHNT